jgi:hypothetical protein
MTNLQSRDTGEDELLRFEDNMCEVKQLLIHSIFSTQAGCTCFDVKAVTTGTSDSVDGDEDVEEY